MGTLMGKFDRYLFRNIFISSLVALIFLLGIDFLIQVSVDFKKLGEQNFTFLILSYVLILQIPEKTVEFLPAAILVGSIMGLGQLNKQNELTIIRAAGISKWRLARAGIVMALLLGLGLVALNEYLVPPASNKSQLVFNQALGRSTANAYAQGIWLDGGAAGYVHIAGFNPDGSLQQLRFYQQQNDGSISIMQAEKADYHHGSWQLSNSSRWTLNQNHYQNQAGDTQWHNPITPQALSRLANTESANTIAELYTLTQFLKANHIDHQKESLRLWQQLLLPLSTLTMLLLALPFTFSQQRTGGGGNLLIGILLGVSYYVLQAIISSLALLLHFPALLGALLPILILGIPPLITLWRN